MNEKLYELSACKIIKGIKDGDFSVFDVVRSCVDRIEKLDPYMKAWVGFSKERAFEFAEAIDKKYKKGNYDAGLLGVPVGVKDIFNTIDEPTSMGSVIWKDFTPGNDSRVVAKMRHEGAVIMGKTVTAEFAVHHPGETVNPHDHSRTPGTSSSGSAVSVAANMVPVALGTQTAGSTIRPASYCGIYGFKPSFGLIPRTGILKTLDTLDHVTFFARALEDIMLLLDVLRVRGKNYPYVYEAIDSIDRSYLNKEWRVAIVKSPVWKCAENYARDTLMDFATKLSSLDNLSVEEVDLHSDFNRAHHMHELIYEKALSYYFDKEYREKKDKLSGIFRSMVERGRRISFDEYKQGLQFQAVLTRRMDEFFKDHDIIISLSTAGIAPEGLATIDKPDSCLIWTLCHTPSLNIPIFKGPMGMPFGAQIVAGRYKDYRLLSFAKFLKDSGFVNDVNYTFERGDVYERY